MELRRIMASLLVAAVGAGAITGCSTDDSSTGTPSTLRVGIIPNIAPDKQLAKYEPFRKYLADSLGTNVELFVATDYAGVVAALVAKRVDLAYLGGLTYVQAREQAEVTPLVTEIDEETGTPRYLSAVVVKTQSPHRSVKDLTAAGGSFAFGDVSSTSGSLYPRAMLVDAGARCSRDDLAKCPPLSKVVFTGGHDAAAQAVLNGGVDAAGLELRILHLLERQGTVKPGTLRVVESREVMGYPWVARSGLAAATRERIVQAFTGITDPALLSLMRARSYVAVTPADYEPIRQYATDLGLLTRTGR